MKSPCRGFLGCLAISSLFACAARAQRPQITTFVQGDGLPSSRIVDLEQHPSGRLWILSRGGVTHFDGHAFRPVPRAGLTDRELQGLEIDAGGRPWTVTRWIGPHVYHLDGERQADGDVFFVADNGAGIDPCYHEKIFGLVERLDPAQEGTGVGLALVKRIVELHGGLIWVETGLEGRGSTFCFTLPPSG